MEPPGINDLSKAMAMAAFQEEATLREAEASCRLEGETQSCETCPLGKDCREEIRHETLKRVEDFIEAFPDKNLIPIAFLIHSGNWREFKKKGS